MGRPVKISTERVIAVARKAFLEHGFGVSTAEIARELGISEGSIYKRFPTKQRLFLAAMGLPDCDFAREWPDLAGEGDTRAHLTAMGRRLIAHFRILIPRRVMLHKQPCLNPIEALSSTEEAPPIVLLGAVTEFLRREITRGVVRGGDPEVVARMFIGALHTHVFFEVIGIQHDAALADEDFVKAVVSNLMDGIAA